jgi:hypothetical protein
MRVRDDNRVRLTMSLFPSLQCASAVKGCLKRGQSALLQFFRADAFVMFAAAIGMFVF